MTELHHGINSIKSGLIYHYDNFMNLEVNLVSDLSSKDRILIDSMNHEVVAYFNRLGQFYYFVKSERLAGVITDYKTLIPITSKFLIFRMKQSAHRATDYPQNENMANMEQLDRLFTYQSVVINRKLFYQVILDEPDDEGRLTVNFIMSENHPMLLSEVDNLIEIVKNNSI
jgi:hypothetical protein